MKRSCSPHSKRKESLEHDDQLYLGIQAHTLFLGQVGSPPKPTKLNNDIPNTTSLDPQKSCHPITLLAPRTHLPDDNTHGSGHIPSTHPKPQSHSQRYKTLRCSCPPIGTARVKGAVAFRLLRHPLLVFRNAVSVSCFAKGDDADIFSAIGLDRRNL
jgi:hypothetical protein